MSSLNNYQKIRYAWYFLTGKHLPVTTGYVEAKDKLNLVFGVTRVQTVFNAIPTDSTTTLEQAMAALVALDGGNIAST